MSCSVHDLAAYESDGLPAVLVATHQFSGATTAQATALGTDPAVVYIPHPVQDRTDQELWDMADEAVGDLLAALTEGPPPSGGAGAR